MSDLARMSESCQTNLVSYFDLVTRSLDCGNSVNMIYLDFSEALDKVHHDIQMGKLEEHGLDYRIVCKMGIWLEGRTQNGTTLDWRKVFSCVPQGSVLGSLFIYILSMIWIKG